MTKKQKASKKLAVRHETLRQLSELDLTRAQGGGDTGATCRVIAFESEATCASLKCGQG